MRWKYTWEFTTRSENTRLYIERFWNTSWGAPFSAHQKSFGRIQERHSIRAWQRTYFRTPRTTAVDGETLRGERNEIIPILYFQREIVVSKFFGKYPITQVTEILQNINIGFTCYPAPTFMLIFLKFVCTWILPLEI